MLRAGPSMLYFWIAVDRKSVSCYRLHLYQFAPAHLFKPTCKWLMLDDWLGRWKHSEVPADITAGHAPKPAGWGLPSAMLLSDASCPTTSLIQQQSIVVSWVTILGILFHRLIQELNLTRWLNA